MEVIADDDVPSCSCVKSSADAKILTTSRDDSNVTMDYGNGLLKVERPRPRNIHELRMLVSDIRFMLRSQLLAYDAKLLIFAAAASSGCPEDTLVPPPPVFKTTSTDGDIYDGSDDGCDMERLRTAVHECWPSCTVMMDNLCAVETLDDTSENDMEAVHLLHWVLAYPSSPMLRRTSSVHLRSLCRHLGVARPSIMPGQLMSISYEDEEVTVPVNTVRRSHAYLGLNFGKLYRFLATGHLDQVGPENFTRLYAQPESAVLQCLEPQPEPMRTCWLQSRFGASQRALVICALPPELERPKTMSAINQFLEYIVHDTTRLRPCYLLFYDEAAANKMMMSWPGHKIEMTPQQGHINDTRWHWTETGRIIKSWAQVLWTGLVAVKRYVWASC